jgi:hypothetical protein
MAQTLHAPKPNVLLQIDYLVTGNGLRRNYFLAAKDECPYYACLHLAPAAAAETTAGALTNCVDFHSSRLAVNRKETNQRWKKRNQVAYAV